MSSQNGLRKQMPSETAGIILVGPGLIGKRHAALIADNTRARLAAVVAPDRAANTDFADAEGVPFFTDLEEAIRCCDADGIIIASPNEFHAAHATIAINAGLPALLEKPITSTLEEARKVVSLAARKDARILIGHHRHHSPLLAKADTIIRSGKLGRIVSFTGSAQFYKPTQYFLDGPWRTKQGGGPILINLIHEIGICRALVGEIDEVHAMASSTIRGFEVEDTVALSLRFVDGALGVFLLSDCASTPMSWEQTSCENLAYPTYPQVDCYAVTGTLGSLHFPTMRVFRYNSEAEASWWTPYVSESDRPKRVDPLEVQLSHFLDVIAGTATPLVSAEDGFQNLRVLEAIRLSICEKRAVFVKDVL